MPIWIALVIFSQVLDDFQVNTEDYPGWGNQYYTAIACSPLGSTTIWADFRIGSTGVRPTACRLNGNGDTIGGNYVITDINGPCNANVDIAGDAQGNCTAVWVQSSGIYARRFNNSGIPLGASFIVNDASGSVWRPFIAEDSAGSFTVVWSDNRNGNYNVYAQFYNADGTPINTNIPVSDSGLPSFTYIDIAINNQKQSIIVWETTGNIWGQRFDSLGNRIGGNFRVNNDSLATPETMPAVTFNPFGDFIVSWIIGAQRKDVCCRIFDSTATPLTELIYLNEMQLDSCSWPKVTTTDSTWAVVFENAMNMIYLQNIGFNGNSIGGNIRINEPIGEMNRYPAIGYNQSVLLITWTRRNYGHIYDIMVQAMTVAGNPVGINRVITDDRGGSEQLMPEITTDSTGNFFIVWSDWRTPITSYYSNNYGRRFNALGVPQSDDFRINDRINAIFSSIAQNRTGLYVSVWSRDYADSVHQVYGQRFDQNGSLIDSNYQISLAPGNTYPYTSRIRSLSNDKYIVTYTDTRSGYQYIYNRFLDSLGNPVGDESVVAIDSSANYGSWGVIDEGNGKYILPISCDCESIAVALREYDYYGLPVSPFIILNESPPEYSPPEYYYVTGAKGIDRYLFVWLGINRTRLWGQFVDDSLRKIGNNFLVAEDTVTYKEFFTIVSNRHGYFFTAWDDSRTGNSDIYGQYFNSTGNRIGVNFKVDNDTTNSDQRFPSAYSANDLIYLAWSDLRIHKQNYDVYCKVMEWPDLPYTPENEAQNCQVILSVNPNPFRSTINIGLGYSAKNRGKAQNLQLRIFDTTGRLIRSFVLPTAYSLLPTVVWDGIDQTGRLVPAGVYFIVLSAGEQNRVQKIIKVR